MLFAVKIAAGVVDHDVDAAQFGHHPVQGCRDHRIVHHVTADRQSAAAATTNLFSNGVDIALPAGKHSDVSATLSESQGDSPANSLTAPSHQGHLAVQAEPLIHAHAVTPKVS